MSQLSGIKPVELLLAEQLEAIFDRKIDVILNYTTCEIKHNGHIVMWHSPAVLRVTLLGLLAPRMTMRSIQERVVNLASGSRSL